MYNIHTDTGYYINKELISCFVSDDLKFKTLPLKVKQKQTQYFNNGSIY